MAATPQQFKLLFHNAFGQPAEVLGFTLDERDGEPVAVKDNHVVRLVTNGDTAVGWTVDDQHLMPFEVRGRNDPKAARDWTALEQRLGGNVATNVPIAQPGASRRSRPASSNGE